MGWLKNYCFEWQFYWKRWHLPWYHKTEDEEFGLYDHWAGIGPFQCRWVTSAIKMDK